MLLACITRAGAMNGEGDRPVNLGGQSPYRVPLDRDLDWTELDEERVGYGPRCLMPSKRGTGLIATRSLRLYLFEGRSGPLATRAITTK